MMFGKGEKITCIEDVALTGAEEEALCLGYKFSRYSLFAPVYMRDDGYVLGVKSAKDTYYPMPAGEELVAFQADGLLPDPLPPYSIPAFEWAFGFLLWIIVGGMLTWEVLKRMFRSEPAITDSPEGSPSTGPGPIG